LFFSQVWIKNWQVFYQYIWILPWFYVIYLHIFWSITTSQVYLIWREKGFPDDSLFLEQVFGFHHSINRICSTIPIPLRFTLKGAFPMKALPFTRFHPVPLRQVRPAGWVCDFLIRQTKGLTGNPAVSGYPYGYQFWGSDEDDTSGSYGTWWPYEQTGYWIDGALKCGYLAGDMTLYKNALEEVDYAIDHSDSDGFIGPDSLREKDRWPHAVFFRAVLAQYEVSGDERYLQALIRHYRAMRHPMGWDRDVAGVEILLYLYQESGEEDLLTLAEDLYARFNQSWPDHDCAVDILLSEKQPTEHGVTFNEEAKLAAMLYSATGNQAFLRAAVHGYEKLDRKALLADGLHSCSEHIQGKESGDMHETCNLTDHTWALAYLLQATGEARYADRIERVIFNALPGSVTKDFRAVQYFSCTNQVIAASNSNHNLFMRGLNWMSYRPDHEVQCCPGNLHRAMPNYVSKMWMRSNFGAQSDNGIVAVLYGPGSLTTTVGESNTPVTITALTRYPYEQSIVFSVHPEEPMSFPFSLRIPSWCTQAKIKINDQTLESDLRPGSFATIDRRWQPADVVRLELPFELALEYWPREGVSLRYGPLTLALPVPTRATVETLNSTTRQRKETLGEQYRLRPTVEDPAFPAWNLYPDGPWNYALCLDEESLKELKVEWNHDCTDPFDADNPALKVFVKARRVKGWGLEHKHRIRQFGHWTEDGEFCRGLRMIDGDFKFTPPLPDPDGLFETLSDEVEEVALIPYGATMLRVTVFPRVRSNH
jgi:hypothetical protein